MIKQQNDEVDEIKGVFVIPEDLSKEKEVFVASKFDGELENFTGEKKTFTRVQDFSLIRK